MLYNILRLMDLIWRKKTQKTKIRDKVVISAERVAVPVGSIFSSITLDYTCRDI